MRNAFWMSSVLLFVSANPAQAVEFWRFGQPMGGGYRHASTAGEGYQRGFADVVRAQGINNLLNSEASLNWEAARRQYIDNRVHGTKAYFELRQINRQARAIERGPKPTMQDLLRYAEVRAPDRLEADELDPLIGTINWPGVLLDDDYKVYRLELNELYSQRAAAGYLTGDQMAKVKTLTEEAFAVLKANIGKIPNNAYSDARNFLKSLAYESFQKTG